MVRPGAVFNVSSFLNLTQGSLLVIDLGLTALAPGNSVVIPIASYGSVNGRLTSVVANSTSTNCVVLSAIPNYGSSTLTVTVSATSCPDQGLSIGAIIGIAVGTVLCGILLALGIVLIVWKLMQRSHAELKNELKQKELDGIRN